MLKKLYSPIAGQLMDLSAVNDEVFAKRMLGDGVAVIPEESTIVSPIDGVISLVYKTKHAIGIKTDDQTEILLHIGLDTVMLDGKPFTMNVNEGDKVTVGTPICKVNFNLIRDAGYDTTICVLVLDRKVKIDDLKRKVVKGDEILEILD